MSMDSPLFLTKVECPVCGTINEFETIRVGAYTEGDRQTDFCPTVIKWRNPRYQKYNPLLFFTATCAKCYYTREFSNTYKEWKQDNNFRTYRLKVVRERHLEMLAAEGSFIKTIGQAIDQEEYPDESAILKLLLASFDELLNEHPAHLDLGRFYLRIGWMFRYLSAGEDRSGIGETTGPPAHLDDIERALSDLRTWIAGLTRNAGYLRDAVAAYTEASTVANPETGNLRERFEEKLGRLEGLASEGDTHLSECDALLDEARASSGMTLAANTGRPFRDHENLGEFLRMLRRQWDGVVCNEMEAIRLAIKYYIAAFESGKQIARGNPTIQAAYLIAELSRQIDDHDTARQYFNTTIKTGQEFINEIRGDQTRTALARKILELAMKQGKKNLAQAR